MTLEQACDVVTKEIEFVYNGTDRRVIIEDVKFCENGSRLLVGKFKRDEKILYRSFHIEQVGEYKVV